MSRIYLSVDSRVDEKNVTVFGFAIKYFNEKTTSRFIKEVMPQKEDRF